jgi:hypothetical protein
MLITLHSVKDVATMLYNSNYGQWSKDYEACLAVAQYLEDLSEETNTPIQVDIIDIAARFSIYTNLEDYNDTFVPSVKTIEELKEMTTVIPLVNGRFIAQNF